MNEQTELGEGPIAYPTVIKVVPEKYGVIHFDRLNDDPEVRTAFNVVAELLSDHGSARITLISGFETEALAEDRASWIRSTITDNGDTPEASFDHLLSSAFRPYDEKT